MKQKKIPEPKEEFVKRISELLPDKKDNKSYWEILKKEPLNSIRCNTLKISSEELIKTLETKGWILEQPFKENKEIIIVKGKKPSQKEGELLISENVAKLEPGELGNALEHLLGYYYIQEISSMLPMIAMTPTEKDLYLDLCAAPGSKTTQAAALMKNKGTIIANEVSMGRLRILASNLERCGATNTIITKKDGRDLLKKFEKEKIKFDKILVDAPCSGEGTLRSSPKTYIMWNPKTIKYLSKLQRQLLERSITQLKDGGELIYSTCTHAPEENEEIVDFALEKFNGKIEIIDFKLPLKTRPGITKWKDKNYNEKVELSKRIYPQDNDTEGFFIAKFRKLNKQK